MHNNATIQIVEPRDKREIFELPEGHVGVEYEFQITTDPAGCTFAAEGLPEGLEMTPEGLIHGYPAEEAGDTYRVAAVLITTADGKRATTELCLIYVFNGAESAEEEENGA